MRRLTQLSILLCLFVSFANPQAVQSTSPELVGEPAPQGTGRFVVFEGFMRAT